MHEVMAHEKKKIYVILTVCSSTFSLALHRTSAWDPEQRLLQVFGCFCSYLSTVEHRVSNLKATMPMLWLRLVWQLLSAMQ